MKITRFLELVVVWILMLGMGCATILSGTKQKISIVSHPAGATAVIDNDNQNSVTTPTVVILSRKDSHVIVISKDGYESEMAVLNPRGAEGWVWGNLVLGGSIGMLIDISSGAAARLKPKDINVTLNIVPPVVVVPAAVSTAAPGAGATPSPAATQNQK